MFSIVFWGGLNKGLEAAENRIARVERICESAILPGRPGSINVGKAQMLISRINKRCGYTMMEMMVILVIVGVISAMAVPGFLMVMPRLKLRADARANLNYLRIARSKAVAENRQFGVYFDSGARQAVLFADISNPANATYEDGADSVIERSQVMSQGINYDASSFAGDCVVFYPSGSASVSGSIQVKDAYQGRLYTISVLASTGRATLQ